MRSASLFFAAILCLSTLHAADPGAPGEKVNGVSMFISFDTEQPATIHAVGGKIVCVTAIDPAETSEKDIEKAIYQLRKLKDRVKEDAKAKKESAKSGDKLPSPNAATEQKYKQGNLQGKERSRSPEASDRLLTFEEFLVLRSQPHVSAAYVDPAFVPQCKGGTCNALVPANSRHPVFSSLTGKRLD